MAKQRLMTNGQLRWWYRTLNRRYWGGRLALPWQILFRRGVDGLGRTMFFQAKDKTDAVELSIRVELRASIHLTLIVLLHEMAHIAHPKAGEGPAHKAEIRRLLRAGAYDRLL